MNKKSFEEIYAEIQNNGNEINLICDEAKKERKKISIIQLVVCLVIDLCIFGYIFDIIGKFSIFLLVPIVIIDLLICVVLNFLLGEKQRELKIKYKQIIIKELINNFYDNLEYFPDKRMPQIIYDKAGYKENYNKYYSDDYLEAKINSMYDIDMAEVLTQEEETHTDSDGNSHTTTTTIFTGLFAKIVLDKSILSELRIYNNNKAKFSYNKLEMDSRRI